ncbi:MAG: hypothetical protein PVF71_10680 [Desulfobacterales bacterium]
MKNSNIFFFGKGPERTLTRVRNGLVVLYFILAGCATTGSLPNSLIDALEGGDLQEVKLQMAEICGSEELMRDEKGKTLLDLGFRCDPFEKIAPETAPALQF